MTLILRIQSPEGTKRLTVQENISTAELLDQVKRDFSLTETGWELYNNRNKDVAIKSSRSKTIKNLGLKHGDMFYLFPTSGTVVSSAPSTPMKAGPDESNTNTTQARVMAPSPAPPVGHAITMPTTKSNVVEDDIDVELGQRNGQIHRPIQQYCKHGSKGKCLHCADVEPYDETYLKEKNIKFFSFHAFLKKLTGGIGKGKFTPLQNLSCRIKPGCPDHSPWPAGICTKCQPNAITLNRQTYRHVDNIVFENSVLVDRLLNYWRCCGHQRVGFLYGRYEEHRDVPLGIRATVSAIYEPPQESTATHVHLLADPEEEVVDYVAEQLGLRRVGWAFTDLLPEDMSNGTVKFTRGTTDTYFLSAEECITTAYLQNKHPNPCQLSSDGYFGSKFVTIVITGDASNHIHLEGYQVSNQCMALVRDECLVPTHDAPELGWVKESTNDQYVPDVFYKEKDQYGNEVTRLARPLPVEYLLVDVQAAVPRDQQYSFISDLVTNPTEKFPVENRLAIGQIQDFQEMCKYFGRVDPKDPARVLEAFADFHLLIYLARMDIVPLKMFMGPLLEAVQERDAAKVFEWCQCEHWQTIRHLMESQVPSLPTSSPQLPPDVAAAVAAADAAEMKDIGQPSQPPGSLRGASGSMSLPRELSVEPVEAVEAMEAADVADAVAAAAAMNNERDHWVCRHCTFINAPAHDTCDICQLPQQ